MKRTRTTWSSRPRKAARRLPYFRRRVIPSELRTYDFSAAPAAVSTAGTMVALYNLAEGNDDGTRNGRKVTPVHIKARLSIQGVGDATNVIRVVIGQVRGATGAFASYLAAFDAFPVLDTIRPVYDRMFTCGHYTAAGEVSTEAVNINLKVKGRQVMFNGAAAANIVDGQYVLLVISDSGAVSHPTVGISTRAFYYDS